MQKLCQQGSVILHYINNKRLLLLQYITHRTVLTVYWLFMLLRVLCSVYRVQIWNPVNTFVLFFDILIWWFIWDLSFLSIFEFLIFTEPHQASVSDYHLLSSALGHIKENMRSLRLFFHYLNPAHSIITSEVYKLLTYSLMNNALKWEEQLHHTNRWAAHHD